MMIQPQKFTVVLFEEEEALLSSVRSLRTNNIPVYDVYTPFPIHGLDDALGLKKSPLHIIGFICGAFGFLLGIMFMSWVLVADWSIVYGGKPYFSLPSFIPISFELMVLCAVLGMGLTFFYWSKLAPGIKKHHFHLRATNDMLVLVLPYEEKTASIVLQLLKEHHPLEITEQEASDTWKWGLYTLSPKAIASHQSI